MNMALMPHSNAHVRKDIPSINTTGNSWYVDFYWLHSAQKAANKGTSRTRKFWFWWNFIHM